MDNKKVINCDILKEYDFDFENIVFEGGGMKMGAHAGAIQVLEEVGILQRCKRFAGTSGGAVFAMLCAIGMSSEQMLEYVYASSVQDLIKDARFGALSVIPNLLSHFGWNPSQSYLKALRKQLKKITGDPDITFEQVYRRYGKVLCVAATNVTTMCVEYFHPKTTPNFSVALAVRASSSLPGYMQPVHVMSEVGLEQFYTDGSLLCNFPLHVFDGWYLSMNAEDSFFNKMGDDGPFDGFNPKTLGFVLYSSKEGEFHQNRLFSIVKDAPISRPNTSLAKGRGEDCDKQIKRNLEVHGIVQASKRFFHLLQQMNVDKDSSISAEEFRKAFAQLQLDSSDVKALFGESFDFQKAFEQMDINKDQQLTFSDFVAFLQTKGLKFQAMLQGGHMMKITSSKEFFQATFNSIVNMTKRLYLKPDDEHRTCGLYTDYIDTGDFHLKRDDKQFLIQQGRINCILNLQHMVQKYKSGHLPASIKDCVQPKTKSQ